MSCKVWLRILVPLRLRGRLVRSRGAQPSKGLSPAPPFPNANWYRVTQFDGSALI